MKSYHRMLTIAGSEPLGSAGLQADIKSASACGAFAAAAVTCILDEDTTQVKRVYPLPTDLVVSQAHSFLSDVGANAIKTGLFYSSEQVKAVAEELSHYPDVPLVVDPVMVNCEGTAIQGENTKQAMEKYLFGLATIITPNVSEGAILLGLPIEGTDWAEMTPQLAKYGCSVLLKSAPTGEGVITDYFFDATTQTLTAYAHPLIDTPNVNGTGCSLSAAIAAFLAQGYPLAQAVSRAIDYLQGAIQSGATYRFGTNFGPVNHFYNHSHD